VAPNSEWVVTGKGIESWCQGWRIDGSYGILSFYDINEAFQIREQKWQDYGDVRYFVEERMS